MAIDYLISPSQNATLEVAASVESDTLEALVNSSSSNNSSIHCKLSAVENI